MCNIELAFSHSHERSNEHSAAMRVMPWCDFHAIFTDQEARIVQKSSTPLPSVITLLLLLPFYITHLLCPHHHFRFYPSIISPYSHAYSRIAHGGAYAESRELRGYSLKNSSFQNANSYTTTFPLTKCLLVLFYSPLAKSHGCWRS